jgi:hypothetical protein
MAVLAGRAVQYATFAPPSAKKMRFPRNLAGDHQAALSLVASRRSFQPTSAIAAFAVRAGLMSGRAAVSRLRSRAVTP